MLLDWRTLPSLSALRAFDATARSGDFAGAARLLNVTHAAVAQQVRGLEKTLGVNLAVRDGRSVRLTPVGIELARSLAQGFEAISEGIETVRDRESRRGIRVTATPFLVDRIIMPRLSEFWDAHPGAEISIHPTREYVDVAAEGFDLAIRAIPYNADLTWPSLDVEPVAAMRVVGIVAPQLLKEASSNPQSLPWLEHEGMTSKLMMMRDCGLDVERLNFTPIGSPNLLLEAVRQGMGATLFSEQFTRDDLASGRLVEVPLPKKLYARYLAVMPKGPRHRLVSPFVEWVGTLF
ncbi:LysR family transcriptional regulator [Actibacterium pelagium]|uniref:Transcriptional regulator n=1 Tax=Actibacterium pelagium TaxID=2029103 RepID=A0A917ABT0_9RHOB|nr:LysR substrate-binding domain-containing protein [Actibacterium pelagium]GGE39727.1 transcriptional regulator [Actibacterium pelagium]